MEGNNGTFVNNKQIRPSEGHSEYILCISYRRIGLWFTKVPFLPMHFLWASYWHILVPKVASFSYLYQVNQFGEFVSRS